MKRFVSFITELEQDWQYMKKPKAQPAVDDYGRPITTPTLPKAEREVEPASKMSSTQQKNISRLQNAPRGTEDAAEYRMRKEYQPKGWINTFPRRVGPSTDPEKEQRSTVDQTVIKRDTQDQMPEINVDEPPPKKRKRI